MAFFRLRGVSKLKPFLEEDGRVQPFPRASVSQFPRNGMIGIFRCAVLPSCICHIPIWSVYSERSVGICVVCAPTVYPKLVLRIPRRIQHRVPLPCRHSFPPVQSRTLSSRPPFTFPRVYSLLARGAAMLIDLVSNAYWIANNERPSRTTNLSRTLFK